VRTLTDDEAIESYEERKREHRGRVEEERSDALAIYAADKLTNVEMLRDAYAESGEEVAGELKVPLDVKIGVWEEDLAMVERRADGDSDVRDLASRLSSQLQSLARSRAGRAGASRG
jgi:hypothetical protein